MAEVDAVGPGGLHHGCEGRDERLDKVTAAAASCTHESPHDQFAQVENSTDTKVRWRLYDEHGQQLWEIVVKHAEAKFELGARPQQWPSKLPALPLIPPKYLK